MLELKTTSKFRRDYKTMKKRGLDMSELETVIDTLLAENLWTRNTATMICTGSTRVTESAIFSLTGC